MIEQFRFSSDGMDEDEAFALYAALYSGGSDVSRGQGPFRANVDAWRLDQMILFDRRITGVVHGRAERFQSDGYDHFVVTLVAEGVLQGQGSASSFDVARQGEIVLMDTAKSTRQEAIDARIITIAVSRDLIHTALGAVNQAHGQILRSPDSDLLADYILSLARHAPVLAATAMPGACRAFMDLLSATAHSRTVRLGQETRRLDFARREAVRRFLDDNIADTELTAEAVGRETGISRSSLYRLFGKQGGVARLILRHRLDALRAALDDGDRDSLADLARRFGFGLQSQMARAFRETYGETIESYRLNAEANPPTEATRLAHRRWAGWMIEIE